jgi:excisionase family DNA binding protein
MLGVALIERGWALTKSPTPDQGIVEKLLTYKQAGVLLDVTERTVWTLVDDGKLPAVRFGRSVRIDPADLRAFIEHCKSTSKEASDDVS